MENENKTNAIIKIMGGFGNQIFQLFFIDCISKKYDLVPKIYIPEEKHKKWFYESTHNICKLAKEFEVIDDIGEHILVNEKYAFHLNDFSNRIEYAKNFNKNVLFDGYFQTPLYWNNDLEYIKSNIVIPEDVLKKVANDFNDYDLTKCVSLNIRLGDYTGLTWLFQVFDENNITKCLEVFDNDRTFIVTSNDIEQAKEIISKIDNRNYMFVYQDKQNDLIYDLVIQMLCGSNIISNGTYSWWGAYLNKNKKEKIVYLTPWIFNGMGDNNDIIPKEDNWIRV